MAIRSFQWHCSTPDGVVSSQDLAPIARAVESLDPQLVLIFADVRFFQGHEAGAAPNPTGGLCTLPLMPQLQALLSRHAPNAAVVGCSTAGEIIGPQVHEGTLTLTALHLDDTRVLVHSLAVPRMEDSALTGEAVSRALRARAANDLHHLWVLAPGVAINGSALVAGLKAGFGSGPLPGISGGLAGDGGAFSRTYTLGPQGITTNHVVGIALSSSQLTAGSSAHGGWEAFGPARRITRAQGNVLYEMDHEPALDIYRRYLGEYAKDLPASGLLFPLQITAGPDQGLIRTILGIDEAQGSLTLAGDVSEDTHVRLMHASPHQLVAAAEKAVEAIDPGLMDDDPCLALLVSCVGRRIVMGDQTEEEVEAVAQALPPGSCITGFYSNGEIAAWHFAGDCRLHNQTMTISWLAETSPGST